MEEGLHQAINDTRKKRDSRSSTGRCRSDTWTGLRYARTSQHATSHSNRPKSTQHRVPQTGRHSSPEAQQPGPPTPPPPPPHNYLSRHTKSSGCCDVLVCAVLLCCAPLNKPTASKVVFSVSRPTPKSQISRHFSTDTTNHTTKPYVTVTLASCPVFFLWQEHTHYSVPIKVPTSRPTRPPPPHRMTTHHHSRGF